MTLPKLYSPDQVRDMFPDGYQPSKRRIIETAKDIGCCCKLGRGIGFTELQEIIHHHGTAAFARVSAMVCSQRFTIESRQSWAKHGRGM